MPPAAHLFINTLQKRAKKTNFSADPNLVSRHGGILGWGRRPLFVKRWVQKLFIISHYPAYPLSFPLLFQGKEVDLKF
jgi:hypothetical protein